MTISSKNNHLSSRRMSSVTYRESLKARRANQAVAAAEEQKHVPPSTSRNEKLSHTVWVVPPRRAVCFLALVFAGAVLALALATPWVCGRLALVVCSVLGHWLVDVALTARFGGAARWYILHALANLLVGLTALPDVLTTLAMPTHCFVGSFSLVPAIVVPGTHLYHLLAFQCSTADWVHHLLFAGVICPLGLFFEPGPVQNTVGFFICGVPGGLDYAMLALVKLRRMSPLTEKVWNARINVWLRSPGLLLAAFCCMMGRFSYYAPSATKARIPAWVVLTNALLCALNGQVRARVILPPRVHAQTLPRVLPVSFSPLPPPTARSTTCKSLWAIPSSGRGASRRRAVQTLT